MTVVSGGALHGYNELPHVPLPSLAFPFHGLGRGARRSGSRRILQGAGSRRRARAGVDPELARCARCRAAGRRCACVFASPPAPTRCTPRRCANTSTGSSRISTPPRRPCTPILPRAERGGAYLLIEDFGTRGLTGDPHVDPELDRHRGRAQRLLLLLAQRRAFQQRARSIAGAGDSARPSSPSPRASAPSSASPAGSTTIARCSSASPF